MLANPLILSRARYFCSVAFAACLFAGLAQAGAGPCEMSGPTCGGTCDTGVCVSGVTGCFCPDCHGHFDADGDRHRNRDRDGDSNHAGEKPTVRHVTGRRRLDRVGWLQ